MSYQKRIIVVLFCVIALFTVSCREQIVETTSALVTQVAGDNYRGIGVRTDARYGTFLVFKSGDQAKKLSVEYLDELSSDELLKWSKGIGQGFVSQLVISQDDHVFAFETAFADPSIAALLNKDGYIMIGNQMYRFYDQVGSYEVLDSNGTVLERVGLNDQLSLPGAKIAACKPKQTKNIYHSAYNCPWNGNKEYHIEGSIAYTQPWIGNQKIVLKTNCFKQACGEAYYNPYSANMLGVEVSYDFIVDGVPVANSMQTFVAYNNNAFSYTLASGSNICLGFVIATHFANPTSSTGLSKLNDIQGLI